MGSLHSNKTLIETVTVYHDREDVPAGRKDMVAGDGAWLHDTHIQETEEDECKLSLNSFSPFTQPTVPWTENGLAHN